MNNTIPGIIFKSQFCGRGRSKVDLGASPETYSVLVLYIRVVDRSGVETRYWYDTSGRIASFGIKGERRNKEANIR